MKIYLSARYSRRPELLGYKRDLEALGHTVIGRWLLGAHQIHDGAIEAEMALDDIPDAGRLFAQDDLEDLLASDTLINFTEKPHGTNNSRGGRHVEFGLALATGKRLIVCGPRENVFHCLPQVQRFFSWAETLTALKAAEEEE